MRISDWSSDVCSSDLPPAPKAPLGVEPVNIMMTGIGGTGVVTAAALVAMAARLEGLQASAFDMTGLAQKNGAVLSHLRIAAAGRPVAAQRIPRGACPLLRSEEPKAEIQSTMRISYGGYC